MIYAGDTEEAIDIYLKAFRQQLEDSNQQLQQRFTENVLDLLSPGISSAWRASKTVF
jgi:hypothetical protein